MKNKYVVAATRWWLAVVCLVSVALSAQAQLWPAPKIQWQRVVEANDVSGPVSGRATIVKNNRDQYSVLIGDRRLLSLTTAGDVIADTPITGVFYDGQTAPARSTAGLAPTLDGGVVMGVQDDLAWALQKRDASGRVLWVTRFLPSNFYFVTDIVPSSDGGFVAFATYQGQNNTSDQPYVIANKVDKDGIQVWYKTIKYPNSSATFIKQAIGTPDDGYLLAGATYAPSDNNTIFRGWAAKLDRNGNITWQHRYDQLNGINGAVVYRNNTLAGIDSYILNGAALNNPYVSSASLAIDDAGNPGGNKPVIVPYATFNSEASILAAHLLDQQPMYIVANDTPTDVNGGDIRLTSFSGEGTVLWTKTLGGSNRDYAYKPIVVATNNGFIVVGITESTDGDIEGKQGNRPATWIVKLEDPAKVLSLINPYYSCQTGQITFVTSGGDGSTITYNAPGISRTSATSNTGTVEQGLRNDLKPITVTATQSGYTTSYTFDLKAACSTTVPALPSPILATVANQTLVANQYLTYPPIEIGSNSYNPAISDDYKAWAISAEGLPPSFGLFTSVRMNTYFSVSIIGSTTPVGVYPVTVTARNTRAPDSAPFVTRFTITVVDQPIVNPPVPPTGNALTLAYPVYNCSTGAITFNISGGDESPITYNAPGIARSSATSNTGIVEQGLRNDPKPITITAMQNGQSTTYIFDLQAACTNVPTAKPPVLLKPIPDQTLAVGQEVGIDLGNYFSDPTVVVPHYFPNWSFNVSELPKGLYGNYGDGKYGPNFSIRGIPTIAGVYSVTLTARIGYLPDQPVSAAFKITIVDNPVVNPPSGNALTLLAPTYDCATGAITFRTSGGNGSVIEYAAAGITGWTSNPNQFVDRDSRTASDVKPFTLMARQNGVMVSYTWDLKAACGRARLSAGERVSKLSVVVLGNPVSDAVTVEVRGVEGQSLLLRLVDLKGRLLESRSVEQAGGVERQRFELHQSTGTGLLLLRASSGSQSQTVKILKQ